MPFDYKEHDIIELTTDDYEIVVPPVEKTKDFLYSVAIFEPLPKGIRGTIVTEPIEKQGGCYVEFPSILWMFPRAECVVWVLFGQMKLAPRVGDVVVITKLPSMFHGHLGVIVNKLGSDSQPWKVSIKENYAPLFYHQEFEVIDHIEETLPLPNEYGTHGLGKTYQEGV
jgi:hypothetical protein